MKKILIITQKVDKDDSNLGFFHEWILEFEKNCLSVTVICLFKGRSDLPKNVKVLSLGKEEGVSKFTYIFRFYKYIWHERKNYDVVFVHMNPVYVLLGAPIWKILGKKISLWYTHKNVDLKLRIAEKLSDKIFTASPESFRLKSKKLEVMGHGINTAEFSPKKGKESGEAPSVLKVLTIGRIAEAKNLQTIFEAIEIINRKKIKVRLEIIGGPVLPADVLYLENLKKWIRQNGLENSIVFLGELFHQNLPKHIISSDVFINMSNTGSMDKVVLEAMACGIPVLTSNEAYVEILRPFDLIIGSTDSKALADKIIFIFNQKEDAQSLGEKLRDIVVREHNLLRLIKKIVEKI